MSNDFFATPPFKPDEALTQLKRSLRELRPLAERGSGFELSGQQVIEFQREEATLVVQLARQPARTPQWDRMVLKNSADVRRCLEDVKRRLARWIEE